MNNEYIPLYFPGFENFPQNKTDLISGLNEKIKYCKKQTSNKNLQIIAKKMITGVEWLSSLPDDSIPNLSGLDYYRLGVTANNIFSVQIWQRLNNRDKMSIKKKIIIISE